MLSQSEGASREEDKKKKEWVSQGREKKKE